MSGVDAMTCREAVTALYELLDGALDPACHERVRAHFDVCSRCYPHLRLEESFRAALRRAGAGQNAPPELKARLHALLAEGGEG